MIDWYIEHYDAIAAICFFIGPCAHLITLMLRFDNNWGLGEFLTRGLATGTAAIIPPFFFVYVDKDVLTKVDGIQFYLTVAALALFYFAVKAVIPQSVQDKITAERIEK